MFCPNCGTKNDIQQSFCRACGMELTEVLQSLSKINDLIVGNDDWLKKIGVFSIGVFGALIICLLTIAIFSSLRLGIDLALVFLMILFGLSLGFLSVTFLDKYQSREAKKLKKVDEIYHSTHQIERLNTNKQLKESTLVPIPSVTEQTTELFYLEKLKPKTSGDLG